MAAILDIWNSALSHLGNGTEVQSETEDTTEANACRRFFGQARDELLSEYPWPFATKTAALALVANNPTTEWAYSYRYPVDCFKAQYIIGSVRNPQRDQRVPYLVQGDGVGGLLIFTDYQDTTNGTNLVYTQALTDPTQWPPGFVKALSFQLASYVGARVTSGDPMKLADRSEKMAQMAQAIAQANCVNEDQVEALPESEFITARGTDIGVQQPSNTFLTQFGQH